MELIQQLRNDNYIFTIYENEKNSEKRFTLKIERKNNVGGVDFDATEIKRYKSKQAVFNCINRLS